jgi:hypothetical protein
MILKASMMTMEYSKGTKTERPRAFGKAYPKGSKTELDWGQNSRMVVQIRWGHC